jgi:hypothetical protein
METAAKATQQAGRSTDRVLEALATLAALLDRTMSEVKALDGDYQIRMMEAVHKTEESLQAQATKLVEQARNEVRDELTQKFDTELKAAMESLRSEFHTERERLGFETEAEREKFNKEISQHVSTVSELQTEKSKLVAELQGVKEASEAEVKRVKAEAEAAVAAAVSSAIPLQSAGDEIARVEAKLAAVIQLVEDPSTELSVVIRKNVEKLELEAYLKGLRFANGS